MYTLSQLGGSGYQSFLISDDISMKSLKHSIANNSKLAFKSGCDLVLHCNGNINEMNMIAKRIKEEFPDSYEASLVDVQLGRLENIDN